MVDDAEASGVEATVDDVRNPPDVLSFCFDASFVLGTVNQNHKSRITNHESPIVNLKGRGGENPSSSIHD